MKITLAKPFEGGVVGLVCLGLSHLGSLGCCPPQEPDGPQLPQDYSKMSKDQLSAIFEARIAEKSTADFRELEKAIWKTTYDQFDVVEPLLGRVPSEAEELAGSVAAMVLADYMPGLPDGSEVWGTQPLKDVDACVDGPLVKSFREQNVAAFCTAFLVDPEHVVTAGHCLEKRGTPRSLESFRIVFGFRLAPGETKVLVKDTDVYEVETIVQTEKDYCRFGADWAILKLKTPVAAKIKPVRLDLDHVPDDDDEFYALGHPHGIPLKYTGTEKVRGKVHDKAFIANLDAFGGNSGSPVARQGTGCVSGILARSSEKDTVPGGKCLLEKICDRLDSGSDPANCEVCCGTGVVRISALADALKESKININECERDDP